MITITFLPQKEKIRCREGTTISAAAGKAGISLDLVCGGQGRCGKCAVLLEEEGGSPREVLACQEKLHRDALVHIPPGLVPGEGAILTETSLTGAPLEPVMEKVFLPAVEMEKNLAHGDFEGLRVALNRQRLTHPRLKTLQTLSRRLRCSRGVTAVIFEDTLVSLEEGDTREDFYGMAVDIGTTTVVAYLYSLNTGEKVSLVSALNRQTEVGGDVMSRIDAAETGEGLARLHHLITETLNQLIREASREAGINPRHIYLVTLVGNTTMQHLFLGCPPHYLGRRPFTSTLLGKVTLPASEVSLDINPGGFFIFLPMVGGFVGADTTAVLLAARMKRSQKLRLAIDIGTNGEVVLGSRETLLACSTAAGPALEGAGIGHGMRATAGAIEDVDLSGEGVSLKVMGEGVVKGICGSGLVACIGEMLEWGIITPTGRLLSREEYLAAGGREDLAERLVTEKRQRVFVLVSRKGKGNICLSQADIRAVQLAKGAISTGVAILLEEMGVKGEELEEVLLAGAFGNYIDVKKGQRMGLVPHFPGVPVRPVGNAAGAGAQMALLSRKHLKEAERVGAAVRHVELASHPRFQGIFMESLGFAPEPV